MSRPRWRGEAVDLATSEGFVTDFGLVRSDTPGLAVTLERVDVSSGTAVESWSVTHIASGRAVVVAPARREAMLAVRLLGRTGLDWTADEQALKWNDVAVNTVRAIRQRFKRPSQLRKGEK